MRLLGRTLQIAGLLSTGVGATSGFWIDVSEGFLLLTGFGGFAVFYVGTTMLRKAA